MMMHVVRRAARAQTLRLLATAGPRAVSTTAPSLSFRTTMPAHAADGEAPGPAPRKMAFQAETRKLLDIVAKSLYSEKEVFIRELISNASDALEKLRYARSTESGSLGDSALEIHISTDEAAGTLTLVDNGIGMTEDELIANLGTIARSGSKAFMDDLAAKGASGARENIIGQFGVGFYSAFMVGKQVEVYTRSAKGGPGLKWTSDGAGEYEITACDDLPVGTKIVIHLHDASKSFSQAATVDSIVKKYSNFVGYPVIVNGARANNVLPLWMMPKDAVKDADYKEFYRFVSGSFDDPQYSLHYAADAPLMLRTLLFVPTTNMDMLGINKQEQGGVSLYTRKVLIQAKCKQLLPDWLRFVKGVVDSEDIPLNLSREMLQDSLLIARLRHHLTGRVIRWLADEAKKDEAKYRQFFANFGVFLKEGVCTDSEFQEKIAKLLRFKSSGTADKDEMTSLDAYVDRMKPEQKGIYYMAAPSRELALESPYYDPFKESGIEVIFLHDSVDEFVTNALRSYAGKDLINIQGDHVDLKDIMKSTPESTPSSDEKSTSTSSSGARPLAADDATALATWLTKTLGQSVSEVRVSKRLVAHPAIVVGHESAATRRMIAMMNPNVQIPFAPQVLEINANHDLISKLHSIRHTNPRLAEMIAGQIFDNAMIAAGLVDDARTMLPRLQKILAAAMEGQEGVQDAQIESK